MLKDKEYKTLVDTIRRKGVRPESVTERYKRESLRLLTASECAAAMRLLDTMPDKFPRPAAPDPAMQPGFYPPEGYQMEMNFR